ncbi:hypothetical protein BU24DRAFT_456622 [Aaosphaeria arxii CBS 175.79]|uniref:Uncharacterized protein n=1 Tax=Aaosphaeria arxii CBS 175.79 TaxID=1450172 RepID=A0A6A5Y6Y1_9PLEO|nr:uncharacterized protein BU24DRAFT_456622 [Aaosphaeria arxii CBS 175.79]KAF2020560.1 hypothetical protein BU24DRAFT_456622 [Aaosphaeria arxii CBS 175.79]
MAAMENARAVFISTDARYRVTPPLLPGFQSVFDRLNSAHLTGNRLATAPNLPIIIPDDGTSNAEVGNPKY